MIPAKVETKENARKQRPAAPRIKHAKLESAARLSISAAAHSHVTIASLESANKVLKLA